MLAYEILYITKAGRHTIQTVPDKAMLCKRIKSLYKQRVQAKAYIRGSNRQNGDNLVGVSWYRGRGKGWTWWAEC